MADQTIDLDTLSKPDKELRSISSLSSHELSSFPAADLDSSQHLYLYPRSRGLAIPTSSSTLHVPRWPTKLTNTPAPTSDTRTLQGQQPPPILPSYELSRASVADLDNKFIMAVQPMISRINPPAQMQNNPLPTRDSRIDFIVKKALTRMILALIATLFLIGSTVIVVYSYVQHVALPQHFVLGLIISESVLILLAVALYIFPWFRRNTTRAARNDDPEAGRRGKLYVPPPAPPAPFDLQIPALAQSQADPRTATPVVDSAGGRSQTSELHGFQPAPRSSLQWSFPRLDDIAEEGDLSAGAPNNNNNITTFRARRASESSVSATTRGSLAAPPPGFILNVRSPTPASPFAVAPPLTHIPLRYQTQIQTPPAASGRTPFRARQCAPRRRANTGPPPRVSWWTLLVGGSLR